MNAESKTRSAPPPGRRRDPAARSDRCGCRRSPAASPGRASGTRRAVPLLRPWMAPVAAAAAVIALAISLVTLRDIPNGRVVSPPRPTPASGGVPRYYAALIPQGKGFTGKGDRERHVHRSAAGHRDAAAWQLVRRRDGGRGRPHLRRHRLAHCHGLLKPASRNTWWYLLRIAPGTSSPARLTRLAIPELRVRTSRGRAVQFGPGTGGGLRAIDQLARTAADLLGDHRKAGARLVHARQDRLRRRAGGGWPGTNTALTWVDDDRALAFSTQSRGFDRGKDEEVTHETLRLLDKSAGGSDLIADSRVIWSAQSVTNRTAAAPAS